MAAKKRKKKQSKKTINPLQGKGWAVIFAFACLLYANTLGHGYVQDDAIVISDNMLTQRGFAGIKDLLTKDTFFGFFKVEGKSRLVAGGRYRPLTPVMFAIEYQLFGLKPWIGHLMNVLLYALTGVIIFLLLSQMASDHKMKGQAETFALVVSALFIAHPIHTEVVANIKGRDEIMSLLLALVAMLIIYKQPAKARLTRLALAAGVFFLALLSKENAITFLAVVPVALVVFKGQAIPKALLRTVPLVLAAGIFLWVRGMVIGWEIGDPPRELLNNPFIKIVDGMYVDFTAGEKSATIMYTLGKYLQLLFFPHPLTHDYYPRHIGIMTWGDWRVILSLLVYLGLAGLAVMGLIRRTLWGFGIVFFLATLSIVSNIVFPVGTNMSERFAYMPSLGWAVAITAAALLLFRRWNVNKNIALGVLVAVLVAFGAKTIHRNMAWKSNYTLFTTDIKTSDNSAKLLAACAGELTRLAAKMDSGPEKETMIRDALEYVQKAQEIHPNYKMSYLLRGNAHYYLEEWESSIASYNTVLKLDPGNAEATKNLGIVYRDAGRYYGQQAGDIQRSIEYLLRAVDLLPTDYETVHSLGVAYGLSGQSARAVQMFERCVELSPDNAMAHFNLGLAYQRSGDIQNAQKHREIAVRLDPDILNKRSANE